MTDRAIQHSQTTNNIFRKNIIAAEKLFELIEHRPYSLSLQLSLSEVLQKLSYPDLAAGAAYKALLLADAVSDESDEYHEEAREAATHDIAKRLNDELSTSALDSQIEQWRLQIYASLSTSLAECGCLQSAYFYCMKGLEASSESEVFRKLQSTIRAAAAAHFDVPALSEEQANTSTWPDCGQVRREVYHWNRYEPDRLNELDTLASMMQEVAPKLEVKATRLPGLASDSPAEVVQLGVFAKEDLLPGEVVLKETSLLTANNKLQDALCDACNADLPDLHSATDVVACQDCEIVFCSQICHDDAQQSYHPALCEREVEAIAKDVPPAEAPDALYALLLLRCLAMAQTRDCHPLEVKEVKYIWGDFNEPDDDLASAQKTLPFSFKYNITLPFHMLEKMDINIFTDTKYDIWVFNTLYAKFRGTASARLSGLGGRAIRGPEVCAVHPMWCLANHSCDPNVSWEWGGEITFRVREERAEWAGREKSFHNRPGVKKGEEIMNHYCDLHLPVHERRAWARGALGGECMCERCNHQILNPYIHDSPQTSLTSKMETTFSAREMEVMAKAWLCMDSEPKISYEKLAGLCGYTNVRSASNAWGAIKKKLATASVDGFSGDVDVAATPKPGKKHGRAPAKKAADDEDGEDSPKPQKKIRASRKAAKKEVDHPVDEAAADESKKEELKKEDDATDERVKLEPVEDVED